MMGSDVWISAPRGVDPKKRFATLQLCIRAEGEQIVRLALIFRGEGRRLSQEEREHYHTLSSLIRVYFQVFIIYYTACLYVTVGWLFVSRGLGRTNMLCSTGAISSNLIQPQSMVRLFLRLTTMEPK